MTYFNENEPHYYSQVKVYFDGSHYVGIPKQQRPSYVHLWENIPEFEDDTDMDSGVFWYDNGKKAIPLVNGNTELPKEIKFEAIKGEQQGIDFDGTDDEYEDEICEGEPLVNEPKPEKKLTLKDVFNELYKYAVNLPKKERNEFYRDNLLPFFADEEQMQSFIQQNIERKNAT